MGERERKMPDEISQPTRIEIHPQPKQVLFLSNPADIVIFGGARGGGKTMAMLMECSRHSRNKKFGAVWFRRSMPEILREGGAWDEAHKLWSWCAKFNENEHTMRWYQGARLSFAQLQYDSSTSDWLGAQIPLLCFDQLETFSEKQFFDLFAANRSAVAGVRPYIRATCNPEPGWLCEWSPEKKGFLSYWIAEDGYADMSRNGKIRWFIRKDGQIYWGDTPEELKVQFPNEQPKSVAFIVSTVFDNQILLQNDESYLSNLQSQDEVTRQRWLGDKIRGGNWRIKPEAGKVFNREWFKTLTPSELPQEPYIELRFWDLAATEVGMTTKKKLNDPDYTAGHKARYYPKCKKYVIMDQIKVRIEPAATDELIDDTAAEDGRGCDIRWEREGGASGKRDSYNIATRLKGYDAEGIPPEGDKIVRAKGLASYARAGNVYLLSGPWNESFKNDMHSFDGSPSKHDDVPDSASGAFNCLMGKKKSVRVYTGS
jgi:predicted phage terminase large subunit-like protein